MGLQYTCGPMYTGAIIGIGGLSWDRAKAAIARGEVAMVSFGKLFLANPELPARFAFGAGYDVPDHATFYGEVQGAMSTTQRSAMLRRSCDEPVHRHRLAAPGDHPRSASAAYARRDRDGLARLPFGPDPRDIPARGQPRSRDDLRGRDCGRGRADARLAADERSCLVDTQVVALKPFEMWTALFAAPVN